MDTVLLPSIIIDDISGILSLNIDENTTLVADFDSNLSGTVTFRIGTEADQTFAEDPEFFTIDPDTGVLSFINPPDFENPLDLNGDNFFQVDVIATNGTETIIGVLDVQVNDVEPEGDDNDLPLEPLAIIGNTVGQVNNISIDENTSFVIDVDTNVDSNLLPGETITFRIVDSSETTAQDLDLFTIDPSTGVLSFIDAPDFENPGDSDGDNVFEVTIEAESNLGGSTFAGFDVTINDVEPEDGDPNPSLDPLEIIGNTPGEINNISIDENDTFVVDIDTNADSNPGEEITFRILDSSETTAQDLDLFTIDPNTGVLSFIDAPDFENPGDSDGDNVFQVDVEAISSLGGTTVKLIDVTVNDVEPEDGDSDSDPEPLEIIGNTFPNIGFLSVDENETFVFDFDTNVDSNPLPGEEITFRILDSSETAAQDLDLFTIDPNTGVLSFIDAPDFENPGDSDSDNIFEVTIGVDSNLGGSAVQTLDITVNDVEPEDGDPNSPLDPLEIIGNTPGEINNISIDENSTFVVDVDTNADSNPGENITFSILDTSNSTAEDLDLFTIDPNTGVLSFIDAPDFENPSDLNGDNVFQVDIQATSSLGETTFQLIDVTVNDVDESGGSDPVLGALEIIGNTPGEINNISIDENDTFVVDIDTNADSGIVPGEEITFRILDSSETTAQDLDLFTINPNTGVLSFIDAPDFENPGDSDGDNIFQVDIEASSNLGGTTVKLIDVIVNDIEDDLSEVNGDSGNFI